MEIMTDEELIAKINELKEKFKPFTRTTITKHTSASIGRLIKMEQEGKIVLPKKMTKSQSAMLAAKSWKNFTIGNRR